MNFKIVTNIETDIFYLIINVLVKDKWKIICEYDDEIFDKSIDFDFYKLAKNEKIILFAWDNWFEGEIKAEIEILKELAVQYKFDLNFNEANFLQDEYITERMKNLLKFHE